MGEGLRLRKDIELHGRSTVKFYRIEAGRKRDINAREIMAREIKKTRREDFIKIFDEMFYSIRSGSLNVRTKS